VATDVSTHRIGDLASPTDFRTTRQNGVGAILTAAQNGTSGMLANRVPSVAEAVRAHSLSEPPPYWASALDVTAVVSATI
jgi:hypothetical protein